MVQITLFTLEEANRALGEIRPLVERLRGEKAEFDAIGTQADVLALALAGASPDNPDAKELARLTERRAELGRGISSGLQAIHGRGAVVKDLDQGLVDFYALSGERLIYLCWQVGEPEITHWHTLRDGFAGRQPLDRLEQE